MSWQSLGHQAGPVWGSQAQAAVQVDPKKGNNDNDNDEASMETIPEREMGEKTWEMEKEMPRAHMLDTENAMLLNTK